MFVHEEHCSLIYKSTACKLHRECGLGPALQASPRLRRAYTVESTIRIAVCALGAIESTKRFATISCSAALAKAISSKEFVSSGDQQRA